MIKWSFKGLLIVLFACTSISLATYVFFYSYKALVSEIQTNSPTIIDIKKGTSLSSLVTKLYNEKIISDPILVRITLQIMGQEKKIKTGVYEVQKGDSLLALMERITEGKVKLNAFTIVEGENFSQIIKKLKEEPTVDFRDIDGLDEISVLKTLGIEKTSPEGLFFPDTYYYPTNSPSMILLDMSKRKMTEILGLEWNNRHNDLPFSNKYQALILASIIEKETGNPSERTVISGVFNNRLKKGMRLQSDPTVIYGLGEQYDGNIKKVHLSQKTPYNTYKIKGLPPTPIAMPGQLSIRAALQPEKTDNLYFVSMGNGSHKFSSSLLDHKKAVTKYQKRKRDGKR